MLPNTNSPNSNSFNSNTNNNSSTNSRSNRSMEPLQRPPQVCSHPETLQQAVSGKAHDTKFAILPAN